MALTGDHNVAWFEGHEIELIRNNWVKTLTLRIDGAVVARDKCHLPVGITLTASLWHNGVPHEVVARATPRYALWNEDTIEVDGEELPLTKTR